MGSQGLTDKINDENSADYSSASCVVRWERFLPKMVVRVLLVEADDSTRQIIAALLRKCSYRVAAVDDGLKAWELLKGRPEKIDLILTEVELPSISGYALLTLIMEHDVCKNIPVIMMSSQDSISMVYKCLLRGATDFLVKPIRKNELRNLWQHLWRKQSSNNTAGPRPPELEATAENNALSNLSDGCIMSHGDRECVEKGTEAESSCGTLEINTEGTHIVTNKERNRQEIQVCEIEGSRAVPNINASSESAKGRDDDEDSEVKLASENSSMEAIDLIGTFDKGRFGDVVSEATLSEFDVSKLLDLCLKSRPNPTDQNNDERRRLKLNHSDASAFSWYANKPHQPNNSTSPDHNPEAHVANISYEKHPSVAEIRPEIKFSYPKEQEISHPIPTRDARLEQAADALASVRPRLPASSSAPDHDPMDQRVTGEVDEGHVSPLHDQSVNNSNICDENASIHQSLCSGSNNGKINLVPVNEEGFKQASSRRSLLREAALMKFRLKRKDRCFEKKVRYESRKKLAEKRPRVRGQFVRQLPNE